MCGLVGIKIKTAPGPAGGTRGLSASGRTVEQQNAATGVTNMDSAGELAVSLLLRLQHRGQDGAGLTVVTPDGHFESLRGLGLIQNALKDWNSLPVGSVAVGHTRYATTGTGGVAEIQPFVRGVPKVALAHNGNIVNTEEIIEKFQLKVETASDLDVLQQTYLKHSQESFEKAVQVIFDNFNGSYATVGMEENGTLFAFRDPFGIRPLFLAESKDVFAVASETCALTPLEPLKVEELQPGEWVRVSSEGKLTRGILKSKLNLENQKRFCMFEVVYFSSPQSEIKESQSIYRLRFQLGQQLGKEIIESFSEDCGPKDYFDYVVPVPETSRTAATAVAETLGIPFREYLVKNAYVPRTFILSRQEQRIKALNAKLSLIGPEIKGQRILLVDDSVVRGNTSRLMALRLREAGARSVTLASTCPPIRYGCFYGIDFPDAEELIASGRDVPQIAAALGVDGLHYISLQGLKIALGTGELCDAWLTGDYPTAGPSFNAFLKSRREQRAGA